MNTVIMTIYYINLNLCLSFGDTTVLLSVVSDTFAQAQTVAASVWCLTGQKMAVNNCQTNVIKKDKWLMMMNQEEYDSKMKIK